MKKLNWFNLKKNRCPSCGKEFGALNFIEAGYIVCNNSMANCNFKISETKAYIIISGQITQELQMQWDKEQGGEE